MHVARAFWRSANGKTYQSIYLRESYRVGDKVQKRNIANLTHCDPKEIAAIELALKHKGDLNALNSVAQVQISQGASVGAVWTVYQVACRLGIERVLGSDFCRTACHVAGYRKGYGTGLTAVVRAPGQGSRRMRCAEHPPRF